MRNKPLTYIIIIILIVLFHGFCTRQKTTWQGTIEEVNGITIIKNPKEPIFPKKIVAFEEDLTMGVEEGDKDYMFNYPVDIDSDSEGNIYVLDRGDNNIKKYDSQGAFIQTIGRKGEGPGEFQSPRFLCISDQDDIYVDKGRNQIEIFALNGKYQRTQTLDNVDQIKVNGIDELFVGYNTYIEGEENQLERVYKLGIYDDQSNTIIDYYHQKQNLYARLSDGEFTFEYPIFVRWNINSKNHICVAAANRYELSVFSSHGELLFKFSRNFPPVKVTGEAGQKISEIINKLEQGSNRDFSNTKKLCEFYPVFSSISIDEKDRIWVKHYKPIWRDRPVTETGFDIFSSEGEYLFNTKVTGNIYTELVCKNEYIYSLVEGEEGFTKAVRYRLVED